MVAAVGMAWVAAAAEAKVKEAVAEGVAREKEAATAEEAPGCTDCRT